MVIRTRARSGPACARKMLPVVLFWDVGAAMAVRCCVGWKVPCQRVGVPAAAMAAARSLEPVDGAGAVVTGGGALEQAASAAKVRIPVLMRRRCIFTCGSCG